MASTEEEDLELAWLERVLPGREELESLFDEGDGNEMTTDLTTTSAPTDRPHPCDVCPTRSPALDSSVGYCEGCPRKLRRCLSCEEYRPQTGWGWGFSRPGEPGVSWVCANCRFPAPTSRPTIAERAAHLEREVTPQ